MVSSRTRIVDPSRTVRTSIVLMSMIALLVAPAALADPASPISLTNSDSPDPVASGAEITYTIVATNTGGSKLTDLVFTDQLNGVGGIGVPPQLVITSTRGSCTQSATLVTCTAAELEGGGAWFVSIRGIVTAAGGTTINNTASMAGTRSAQSFTTTTTTTTLVSGGSGSSLPDLTVAKTGPSAVLTSSPMTYFLTINNIGSAPAANVKVVDTVPVGLTAVSASGTSLFNCAVVGQTVTCTGGAVNQGTNATITINATSPALTGPITNTASVDPDNAIAEGNELNNSSALVNTAVLTELPQPVLTVNLTDSPAEIPGAGNDPSIPGSLLTYKVLATNTGAFRADDVTIVLGTQGLEASSIQVSQVVTDGTVGNFGGCSVAAPQAKCVVRTLNPGGTILMTVTGQVVASAGSMLIATATVTGNIRNTGYSDTDTELTTIKPGIDLTITKSDSPDPVCARSWPGNAPLPLVCRGGLTYTFVVGNSGIYEASGVTIRDPLIPGAILDSYNAPAFSGGCSVDGSNVLTCMGGTIGPESTTVVTVVLTVPDMIGSWPNTVTVDPDNAIFEADETNNTASATTQVITGVDLTVAKADLHDPIAPSGTQVYTISVNNLGTQDVTNIRVRDTLPAETIFRDVVSDHNFTCSHANGIVECVGGALKGTASNNYGPAGGNAANPPDTATITIRIFAQPFDGVMHNEVRVDPDGEIAEANELNNIAVQDTVVVNGGPAAFNDLQIEKTATAPVMLPVPTTFPLGSITYSIKVWNEGSDPALNVTVRDVLPVGVTYVSAADAGVGPGAAFTCAEAGGVVTCSGATILAGGVASARFITINATAPDEVVPAPGLHNVAEVDPFNTIPEGNEYNNSDSADVVVASQINLKITKSGPTVATQSNVTDYTLVVTNEAVGGGSGQIATSVLVTDAMPPGLIPLAWDAGTGNNFSCQILENPINVVSCVGDLPPGDANKVTIKITVFITAESGRPLDNVGCVDPNDTITESNELDNCSEFGTFVAPAPKLSPDLLISKTVDATQTTPGSTLTYTVTVSNVGTAKAKAWDPVAMTGLTVTDALPAEVTFINFTTTNGWTCAEASGTITCHDGGTGLDVGQSAQITILASVDTDAALPIVNSASAAPALADCLDPSQCENETAAHLANNTATAITGVGSSGFDLAIASITDNPDPVAPGQGLKYTVVAVNGGTTEAANVVIRIERPTGGVHFDNADGSNGFNCSDVDADTTDCVGTLPAGGDTTITVNFTTLTSALPPDVTLTATIDPGDVFAETNEGNNTQSEVTTRSGATCSACVDLVASQLTVDPEIAFSGDTLTITLQVVNIGDTATALVPGQKLAGLAVISDGTVSSSNATSSNPAVTCAVTFSAGNLVLNECEGNLAPSQGVTITFTTTVTGTYVEIYGAADQYDVIPMEFNESNNYAQQSVVLF